MAHYQDHFADVAPRYDALRQETTAEVLTWLSEASDFTPRQAFVDIACGTGLTTAALARRHSLAATGVDASPQMLAIAAARNCAECRFVRARAEQLPFEDASFDRGLIQTAVHLMDRDVAFAQTRRVLRPEGRLVILTVDPASVDGFWLAEWFPSYPDIDRRRFPAAEALTKELSRAGFAEVETRSRTRALRFTRDRALAMLRGRFASSFAVMDQDEFEAGLERAEREMPARFESSLRLLLVTAR